MYVSSSSLATVDSILSEGKFTDELNKYISLKSTNCKNHLFQKSTWKSKSSGIIYGVKKKYADTNTNILLDIKETLDNLYF